MVKVLLQGQYSLARAQQSFKSLVQIHEKNDCEVLALCIFLHPTTTVSPPPPHHHHHQPHHHPESDGNI
ncbi:hypothetical protein E2C01_038997 [Portunus trituberculatus]|uniref:Uncharacterized protein n=1 Tax=Portunus trituberculatus TaxID=210409 RepID=A0A5B7FFN3_PORTR|nr:hypothetical protein [Portunus trituberculatus]